MKTLLACATLIIVSTLAAAAPQSKGEQEVRRFMTEYDNAVASRDIAFLEHVLPEDYVYTAASGRMSDRASTLTFLKQQRAAPRYRMNSLRHENINVRVVGNMAVVTNEYVAQTTPMDSPDAEPHTDKGRHTAVYEKRRGHWMVIAEQDTEQPHDEGLMEREVLKAGRDYNELMKPLKSGRSYAELEKSGNIAALHRVLDDQYRHTNRDGKTFSKADDVASYKTNRTTLDSAEALEQIVRVIDNSTAVETGKNRYIGTDAGKPFDLTERYTTTWVFGAGRSQIIAGHTSLVTREN